MNWRVPHMLLKQTLCIALAGAVSVGCSACLSRTDSSRKEAHDFREQEQYDDAIAAYYKHINDRLSIQNRQEWENPYIYLLDIGDIYLAQNQPDKALAVYEEADAKQVDAAYINDRLRNIASWHENRGDLAAAIEHLKKYRHRDEFMFDLMLNRLAKELVFQEENGALPDQMPTAIAPDTP